MASLKIILPGHSLRTAAEDLVKTVYAKQYGARISTFPPVLAALMTPAGVPYCAAGLRVGLRDCFSETYLDHAIQDVFSKAIGEPVPRDQILEITGLASIRVGASFALFREIALYGRGRGMRFSVFTATQRLRQVIKATRVPLIELSPAQKSRVENPEDWGTYYDNNPWVCGLADTFLRQTKSRLSTHRCPADSNLQAA